MKSLSHVCVTVRGKLASLAIMNKGLDSGPLNRPPLSTLEPVPVTVRGNRLCVRDCVEGLEKGRLPSLPPIIWVGLK